MKKMILNRRTFLRGALQGAAISVALPPLEAMLGSTGKAYADGSAFPKRFGLFMWGNGVVPDNWVPAQTGRNYQLSPILTPLAAVKDSISVITGTSVLTANVQPHFSGAAGILSGAPLVQTTDSTFMLPSVDQIIANAIGSQTRFQSLQCGADPGSGLSYNGPDNQNPPQSSPQDLFTQLFVNGFTAPGQTPVPNPMLMVRASILDAVINDASALRTRLGTTDRARLDQHLTGIRELEMRLSNTKPPVLASCRVPTAPAASYPDINGLPDLQGLNKAFCDIMALALACDQTRVFSNYFTYPVSNPLFPGAIEGHHQLTHDELDSTINGVFMEQPQVTAICVQIMQQFAYQIEALRAIPEGEGTLLDNCVVLGTTDCSFGRTHALNEYPIVIAGTASGALPTGFHYRSTTNENASEVLFSIVQAMGVPIASFGAGAGLAMNGLPALEMT